MVFEVSLSAVKGILSSDGWFLGLLIIQYIHLINLLESNINQIYFHEIYVDQYIYYILYCMYIYQVTILNIT